MKKYLKHFAIPSLLLAISISTFAQHQHSETSPKTRAKKVGVLLLAHGGKQSWNDEVKKVAAQVEKIAPVEIAFGMASKATIQPAVDGLISRGATEIVAVPLFISSNSSVITSTQYLLGQRPDAPADLAKFASMNHGDSHGSSHSAHGNAKPIDPLTPVSSSVPVKMLSALDSHPIVAEILLARAHAISKDPENEVIVIVAHGPVSDETNALWLNDMGRLAKSLEANSKFKRIEYLTVRDDAPEPIRSAATTEFRSIVSRAGNEKSTVLIVPLLLSFGGIEEGVKKRLDGLAYKISPQALLPDPRISTWVIESVQQTSK